jgi:hypothetical protein
VSAIWIGLFIYFAEPKTYSWFLRAPKYDIEFSSGHQTTFDTSKSHQELVADVTEEWKREAERLKIRDGQAADEILRSISAKRDELLETFNSNNKKLREQAQRLWLATFIPPLVLLGLGLCIAWILRGFRAQGRDATKVET